MPMGYPAEGDDLGETPVMGTTLILLYMVTALYERSRQPKTLTLEWSPTCQIPLKSHRTPIMMR